MNNFVLSLLFFNTNSAWNWRVNRDVLADSEKSCKFNKSSTFDDQEICWEAMGYKRFDLSNVTAVFQPGYWERDYPEINDFCDQKGNGTFCYRPKSDCNNSCLDMAVVRCPEGIISSCRSNFICNEMMNQNITCGASVGSIFNSSFVESGQAQCQAIEDVIKLPPAQNITTTVDQQNRTLTIGSQIFGFPFATTTTVDCTFTCLSSLPSGFPQPIEAMTACFNDSLPYDQLIPKTTCIGPYPPGPMTTVTQYLCNSTSTSAESTSLISSPIALSSSTLPVGVTSECPIGSVSSSSSISSEKLLSTEIGGGPYTSSMSEIYPSPCESSGEMPSSSFEPTPTQYYY